MTAKSRGITLCLESSTASATPSSSSTFERNSRSPLHFDLPSYSSFSCETRTHIKNSSSSSKSNIMHALILVTLMVTAVDAMVVNSHTSQQRNALALLNTARLLHEQRSSHNEIPPKTTDPLHPILEDNESTTADSSWKNLFDDDFDLDNLEKSAQDVFISSRVEAHLPSVKSLRTSLGSEVPDMELHLQMEAAKVRSMSIGKSHNAALAFMDLHHEKASSGRSPGPVHQGLFGSASAVEKFAMSSLPSQLPELATTALSRENGKDSSTGRVGEIVRNDNGANTNTGTSSTDAIASENVTAPTTTKLKPIRIMRININGNGASASRANGGTKTTEPTLNMKTSPTVRKIKSKDISTIMTARKAIRSNTKRVTSTATSSSKVHSRRSTQSESSDGLSAAPSARVSHDEELQLARIIQRGVILHSIKSKFEEKHGRDITRQEWAELAQLESPKQLRRMVSDYRQAKNKLVMANMGLVHAVVRSKMGISSGSGSHRTGKDGISYEEMVQEGSLGLLRAAELFDPSRGLRFSTYATIWIKGVLGNSSISETITVPLRERTKWNKIQTAIADLQMEYGAKDGTFKPSHAKIGARSGMDIATVKKIVSKMKRAKNVLSLDYQYETQSRSGAAAGKFDALSNDKNLMDDVDLVERLHVRADVIAAIVRNLDPREARLIRLRYGLNDGLNRSIKDCAEAMGISQSRAQQLAAGCLKKLREADDAESLQEYLLSVA